MRPVISIAFACLLTASCSIASWLPATAAVFQPERSSIPPKATILRGDGWAIAAPDDWTQFPAVRPPMVLYLVGDARNGIPAVDGSLAALKVGLTVEVFPAASGISPRDRADRDLDELKHTRDFRLNGEPEIAEIKLADGTSAIRLKVQIAKSKPRRLALYDKVYCATSLNQHVVATGFLACSLGGNTFLKRIGLIDFIDAHAESLVLDAAKLGPALAARLQIAQPQLGRRLPKN